VVTNDSWGRDSDAYDREANRMKATWQSRPDVAVLEEACLEDEKVTYDVFYGTSDNKRSWFDIDHAREVLGYEPRDSADELADAPPGGRHLVEEETVPL